MIRRGFTLIEILIAIFVFSVGILAVLSLVTQNLRTMHGADVHRSAAFLAQESLSLLSHIRDTNVANGVSWDCIPSSGLFTATTVQESDVCDYTLGSLATGNKLLLLGASSGSAIDIRVVPYVASFDQLFADTRLSTVSGSDMLWYGDGRGSDFARYLVMTGVTLTGQLIPRDILLKVSSVVLFKQ